MLKLKQAFVITSIATMFTYPSLSYAEGIGVTGRLSTLGLGVEVTKSMTASLNARVGFNTWSYDKNFSDNDGIEYDFNLELRSMSALLDWHPFNGGFRLSGGLFYNKNNINATARPQSSYTIGNNTYTAAQIGSVSANIDFKTMVPYLGIGWGNAVGKDKRLGFVFDLGIVYQGSPDVSMQATGLVASDPTFQADLAQEEQQLQNDVYDFKYYPVISLGMSYQF